MNYYLIEQDVNNNYDTFDSAVVVSENMDTARNVHPRGSEDISEMYRLATWTKPENVTVKYLGEVPEGFYKEGDVICASFNAG